MSGPGMNQQQELAGDAIISINFSYSDHEVVKFRMLWQRSSEHWQTSDPDSVPDDTWRTFLDR